MSKIERIAPLLIFVCLSLINSVAAQTIFLNKTKPLTSLLTLQTNPNKKHILNQDSNKYNRRSRYNRQRRTKQSKKQKKAVNLRNTPPKNTKTPQKTDLPTPPQNNSDMQEPAPPQPSTVQINHASTSKIDQKIKTYINRKQLDNIQSSIIAIPVNERSAWHQSLLNKLFLFDKIKKEKATFDANFISENEIDPNLNSQTTKLYLEAKKQFLNNQNTLSKDLLIQILFLDQKHFEAKALLTQGLQLNSNEYIVENIPLKYWLASDVNYYSGNYQAAIEKLNTLLIFEPNNAKIYEKLGSNYYNATLFEKAIDAWKIAISLDPSNKELPIIVKNTSALLKEQKETISKNLYSNQNKTKNINLPKIETTTLIGVFFDQESAIKFKNQKIKENPNIKLFTYNKENGSIEIRIKKNESGGQK